MLGSDKLWLPIFLKVRLKVAQQLLKHKRENILDYATTLS
jgi:hypothetical protein